MKTLDASRAEVSVPVALFRLQSVCGVAWPALVVLWSLDKTELDDGSVEVRGPEMRGDGKRYRSIVGVVADALSHDGDVGRRTVERWLDKLTELCLIRSRDGLCVVLAQVTDDRFIDQPVIRDLLVKKDRSVTDDRLVKKDVFDDEKPVKNDRSEQREHVFFDLARASDLVNSPSSPFPSGREEKEEGEEGCLVNNQGADGVTNVTRAAPAPVTDPRDLRRQASTPGPRPQIAPEIWAVVEKHETTSRWAVDPYGMWAIALADWVSETRAEARHVKAVLDMFEAEATELHRAGMLVKAQNDGTFPKAQNLWFRYGKHASASAWVGKAFERVMTPTVVDSTPTTDARLLRFRGDS